MAHDGPAPARYPVTLGEVPTRLLAAKAHVDNLVREFTLAARGAESGVSGELLPHLASLIETVVTRYSEARQSIKRQAIAAADQGLTHVRLELNLPLEVASAGEDYLRALDDADWFTLRALTVTDIEPASVVAKLTRALLGAQGGDAEAERFCTALFGVIAAGPPLTVALAAGGHRLRAAIASAPRGAASVATPAASSATTWPPSSSM